MKVTKNVTIFLVLTQFLVKCAPPPTPQPLEQIVPDTPKILTKGKRHNLLFKRLESSDSTLVIENSTVTVRFYSDYKTIEHQLIIIPHNLSNYYYIKGWSFSTNTNGIILDDIYNTCEMIEETNGKTTQKYCEASQTIDNGKITFSYNANITNKDRLIVNYKYTKTTEEILYKMETILIPLVKGSSFCNYKYIIPDGFINLGLLNNLLTKESNTLYSYLGQCPTETLIDIIRYSPETVLWEADMKLNLKYSPKFTNNVNFIFPRYYTGGKLIKKYFIINSIENEEYNEDDIIYENTKYKITIHAANKNKIVVELNTNFTNNLTREFNVYLPEKYYSIDLSNIDQEIQDKANEIISESSEFPDYYKLGKYIYSNMTYDINYTGKNLTLKEIYQGKTGVCEHYTLLYNAMLNSIGIKTLYITGWAFNGNQTSGDDNTIGHAWTAALIDGKWKELDATWGLFEGISSGHIFKNFYKDIISYSYYETNKNLITFDKNHDINMISIINRSDYSESNVNDDNDNYDDNVINNNTVQNKTGEETQSITDKKNVSDNKDDNNNDDNVINNNTEQTKTGEVTQSITEDKNVSDNKNNNNTEEVKNTDKSNENESDKKEEVIVQTTSNNEEKTDKKEDNEEEEVESIEKIIYEGRNEQYYLKFSLTLLNLFFFILC